MTLLTDDQIRGLCRRRDAGVVAGAAATQPAAAALAKDATPDELQILITDGIQARNTLVEANTGLVGAIVNRTVHGRRHHQDYLQEGMTALIAAVDRFNPDRGTLATYASPYIRGAVLNLISIRGGDLHLTRSQARSKERVRTQTDRLAAAGLPAGPADVATHLSHTEEWVRRHVGYQLPVPLTPTDGLEIQIADTTTQERIDAIGSTPITTYLGMLPARERAVLELVHGFAGEPRSLTDISAAMGVSKGLVEHYVASGHVHLRELLGRFEQQLVEGQTITKTRRSAPSPQASSAPATEPRRSVQQPLF